jgi:hypothetical protein
MVSRVGRAGSAPGSAAMAPAAAGPREGALLRAAAVTRESTSQLTIVTDEGDRVTLSLRSSVAEGAATYSFRGHGAGGVRAVEAAASQRSVTREATLLVEGDLSKDELKDIRRLIHDARGVARRFFRGDLAGALARVAHIDAGGSLAGFSLSVQHTQPATGVAAAVRRAVAPPAPAPSPAPPAEEPAAPPALTG